MAAAPPLESGLSPRAWVGLVAALLLAPCGFASVHVVIVEGLGGEPSYTEQFDAQVQALHKAALSLTPEDQIRSFRGAEARRGDILQYFREAGRAFASEDELLVYLIGHGSYDGQEYKFNIPGPDLTGHDIATMLDAVPARRQLVVATGSASGALLAVLKKPTRIVITATRSGNERNATRFGAEFVAAFTDPTADTDKDDNISAREAYDFATRRVKDYFQRATQLATEHAVLEGDAAGRFEIAALKAPSGAGVAASSAQGPPQTAPISPQNADLLQRREALNRQIEVLRGRKGSLSDADYSAQLENLLLQLAQVQERLDTPAPASP
jgi:hypothetical protein